MRISARSLATTLLAVGVASCSDTPIAAVKHVAGPAGAGFVRVGFAPVFSKTAQYAAQHADEFGIQFDSVRVAIRDTPDTNRVVIDTTVFFDASSPDLKLDLQVPTEVDGQRFDALVEYLSPSGQVVYSGHSNVQSYPAGGTPPAQTPITINFVGPGARAAKIVVSPKTVSLLAAQTAAFTVTATDSSGAPITVPPIAWSTSDTSAARISSTGVLIPTGHRATVTVMATTPTGLNDNASATITLPPAGIAVVSGAGQTGKVGAALPNAAVVQVSASDGVGVPGITVIFSAPNGGAVGVTSALTDANGRASTTLRLGSVAGAQGFAATAASFSVGIPVIATAGDPAAIAALSGGGQTDTVLHALKQPLVVHVSDQFNNPVAGATITWSRVGAGALSASSSTTNADGNASVSYTLGTAAGSESISAAVSGVNAQVSFAVNAVAGVAMNIGLVSGNSQAGVVNAALGLPFVVRITDDHGNPSPGATVNWSSVNGTVAASTTSDVSGQALATMTLGRVAGSASAMANLPNGKNVTFAVTAAPGSPAALVWQVQPSNAITSVAITPAMQVAIVDAFGNVTTSTNSVTIALNGGPNGAKLAGTLTRNAVGGVATFNDITISGTANGFALAASSGTLPSINSAAFGVSAGTSSTLSISAGEKQTAAVNTAVSAAPAVQLVDATGNPVQGATVTFATPAGSGTVSPSGGGVTTNALGVAALTSWTLGTASGAQTLVASAPGVPSVTFHATALAGAAAGLVWLAQPVGGSTGLTLSPAPQLRIVDAYGNSTSATSAVTLSLTGGATGAILAGTLTRNAVAGVATFNDITIDRVGTGYALTATLTSPTVSANSASFGVVSSGATQLVLSPATATNISFVAGATPTSAPVVRTLDAAGNGVPNVAVHFAITTVAGGVSTLVKDTIISSDATGTVSVGAIPLTTAGTFSVGITSGVIAGASLSLAATVAPTTAARISMPNGNTIVDTVLVSPRAYPSFKLVDAYGNAVPNQSVTFSVSLPCSLISPPLTFDGNGAVTFANSSFLVPTDTPNPSSCQLTATSGTLTAAAYLIVAPGSAAVWTGSAGSEWMNAANWSTGVVPSASTPIYVPLYTASAPKLGADQAVGSIIVADTARVDLGTHTLTSYGSVDGDSTGTIVNGKLILAGSGTVRGILPTTTCSTSGAGQYTLGGRVYVRGSLILGSSCSFSLSGNFALVDTNFATIGTSTLSMNSPNDELYVMGNASFGGTSTTLLSDGSLVVLGNLTQTGSFGASGNNSVYLAGSSPATVSFTTPSGAHLNNLYIASSGADSVHLTTPLFVDDTLGLYAAVPLTLEDTNAVTVAHLVLASATRLVLNGRAQMTTRTCAQYIDPLNPASNALVSNLLEVLNQNGNSQGACTATTGIPTLNVPGTSTVTALRGAAMTVLRRPARAALLR